MTTLPHHMRIAALQCNFEGGRDKTLQVPRVWKDFGFNVEQLLHTHADLYTAVFEKDRHGDLLIQYVEECKANNIAIILYMNCHILFPSQTEKYPEWSQYDKKGNYVLSYGTYNACCLNSSWTDYFLDCLEDLRGFDLAGVFFDGPVNTPCYCKHCDARFSAKYGKPIAEASKEEANAFATRCKIDFMKKAYDKVKDIAPHWIAYYNLGLMHGNLSAAQWRGVLNTNDIIGTEGGFQFYGPPKNTDIWRCGANAKLVEAVAGDKPRVIFMAGDHKPWSWYLHTPAETKLCYASSLANGSSVWYGIHCSTDNLDSEAGRTAKAMAQFDKQHNALYAMTRSLADVALFFSFDTANRYASSAEETDFYHAADGAPTKVIGNYSDAFQGAYATLFRSGIAFDIVTELNLDTLARYKVVILPTGACMSDDTGHALKNFVTRGGVLVADSETSLYDETGKRRQDFLLADIFGAGFSGYREYHNHDYVVLEDDTLLRENPRRLPAPLGVLDVAPAQDVHILAKLCPPLAGRYSGKPEDPEHPFLLKRTTGRGACYYLAGTFFELYRKYGIVHYRRLIETLVRAHSVPVVELLHAPESLEFTVRESGDAVVIHLVNYTGGMTRPIEKTIPLTDLELKINIHAQSAKALVSGKTLDLSNSRIKVPEIREFEVIVVERS